MGFLHESVAKGFVLHVGLTNIYHSGSTNKKPGVINPAFLMIEV